jgi:cytochrome b
MKYCIFVGLEILSLFVAGYLAWDGVFRSNAGETWIGLFILFLVIFRLVLVERDDD